MKDLPPPSVGAAAMLMDEAGLTGAAPGAWTPDAGSHARVRDQKSASAWNPLGIGVAGIAHYVPTGRQHTSQLVDMGLLTEREHARLGVASVPVADRDEHASDLMLRAARQLLDGLSVPTADIGLVITASTVPGEYQVRTLAARVAHELGATRATGFDVNQGCNGFATQIQLATALLTAQPDIGPVLLVAGDRWREYTRHQLATGLIYGDAGAAALVTRDPRDAAWVPIAQHSYLDASLHAAAGVPLGSRAWAEHGVGTDGAGGPSDLTYAICDQEMITREFIPRNMRRFQDVAETVLKRAGITWDDLTAVLVPPSRRDVMVKLLHALGWDEAHSNLPHLADHGDLAVTSPYVHLAMLGNEPWVRHGAHILALTQGTGMTWTGTVFRHG